MNMAVKSVNTALAVIDMPLVVGLELEGQLAGGLSWRKAQAGSLWRALSFCGVVLN